MSYVLIFPLILLAAFVVAVFLLGGIEFLTLVSWKLKRCPQCQRRLGFAGWSLSEWENENVRHTDTVNGEVRAVPWVVVTCPHCAFEIATREAPSF